MVGSDCLDKFISLWNEPKHDKNNKITCAPSIDSDQPGHLPNVIKVFAVHLKKVWVLNYSYSLVLDA